GGIARWRGERQFTGLLVSPRPQGALWPERSLRSRRNGAHWSSPLQGGKLGVSAAPYPPGAIHAVAQGAEVTDRRVQGRGGTGRVPQQVTQQERVHPQGDRRPARHDLPAV